MFIHNKLELNEIDIKEYREFDYYELDIEVYRAQSIHIASKLPSEPPKGITYNFGPSGFVGNSSSNYCVIPTTWRNVDNYCHWNFSELPFLFLAFESNAKNIVLPDSIIDVKLPFQKRWMELLYSLNPDKKIYGISKSEFPDNSLIPINHDTSISTKPIGKCQYKHYHHSRATPYLIDRIEKKYKGCFDINGGRLEKKEHIYINRSSRRLKNELEIQELLVELGFEIVNLEHLTLDEQVFIFSNAKTIVGFHGAGLSNLLYSDSLAQVVEIVDIDCVYPSYIDGLVIPGKKATKTYFHMLSEMKGMSYYSIESNDYFLNKNDFKDKLIKIMYNQH